MARVTFIARMTCRPEHRETFVSLCRLLENYVRDKEPDTVMFEFFKLREPDRYAVLESFRDESAETLHMTSTILAETAPKISACLDGGWVREYFDPLS
jgi:quinol monooxygenase YgiN